MPPRGDDSRGRAPSLHLQVLDPAVDQVGDDYFNGVAMIKKKTQYAIDHMLGGVMIWESGYGDFDVVLNHLPVSFSSVQPHHVPCGLLC